jgi:hypothetical protein
MKETARRLDILLVIKIYLREIGWSGMDWINQDQDRYQWKTFVNTVMNLPAS